MPHRRKQPPPPEERIHLSPEEESFGQRLERARAERGLTQMALSEISGLPQPRLHYYEADRGVRFPNVEYVRRLEEVLGLPENELLRRTGWAISDRQLRGGAFDPRNIFIESPSPTLRRLMAVIAQLDETGHDRLLRYAEEELVK